MIMIKIIVVVLIIIIFILVINYFNIISLENFASSRQNKSLSSSNRQTKLISGTKTGNNRIINNIQSSARTPADNPVIKQQQLSDNNNVMFTNKDYNENLSVDNKDNKYYYDDMINQSNINETAFNIIYSIDPIDYADVKTGIQKCNEDCKGVCFENGYDGIATCYPKESKNFDWGTLYKNPTFTYGYNAYGPNNLKQ
jgi:hypothetical protein